MTARFPLIMTALLACCTPRPSPSPGPSPDAGDGGTPCSAACQNRLSLKACPTSATYDACLDACLGAEAAIPGVTNAPCVAKAKDCEALKACSSAAR